eukprot:792352-Pelagomonas_calceolata.AAC.1
MEDRATNALFTAHFCMSCDLEGLAVALHLALMQSWSLLTQLTHTDHTHTHTEYCTAWGGAQLQPTIST